MNIPSSSDERAAKLGSRSRSVEHLHFLAMRGLTPLISPVPIHGKFGYISLNDGFITGWQVIDDNLVVSFELPDTPQKVEIGPEKEFTLTFPIQPDVNPSIEVTGQVLHEEKIPTESDQERYLELLLKMDPTFKQALEIAFSKNSYSKRTVIAALGAVRPSLKPWQKIAATVFAVATAAVGVRAIQDRKIPEETMCTELANNKVPNRKPGYIKFYFGSTDPQDIVGRCRQDLGVIVPIENARTMIEKSNTIEK